MRETRNEAHAQAVVEAHRSGSRDVWMIPGVLVVCEILLLIEMWAKSGSFNVTLVHLGGDPSTGWGRVTSAWWWFPLVIVVIVATSVLGLLPKWRNKRVRYLCFAVLLGFLVLFLTEMVREHALQDAVQRPR